MLLTQTYKISFCQSSNIPRLYDQDNPAVKMDFGETGVHQIHAMTVQFPAKFSCGTAERRILP
jgi:hypothetical protein